MRKLKHRELADWLAEIDTRLAPIRPALEQTVARANVWMDDGNTGQSYGGSSSRSGHGDPVGARVEAGVHDRITRDAMKLRAALLTMRQAARDADAAMWGLRVLTEEEAHTLTESEQVADIGKQTLSAACANPNCDYLASMTGTDRLWSGRCSACYQYRRRTGRDRIPKTSLELDTERVVIDGAA